MSDRCTMMNCASDGVATESLQQLMGHTHRHHGHTLGLGKSSRELPHAHTPLMCAKGVAYHSPQNSQYAVSMSLYTQHQINGNILLTTRPTDNKLVGDWMSAPSPIFVAIATRVGPTRKSLCAQIVLAAITHVP